MLRIKTLWVHYSIIYTYLETKFSGKVYRFWLPPGKKWKIWLLCCARPYLKKIGWGTKKSMPFYGQKRLNSIFIYFWQSPWPKIKRLWFCSGYTATRALAIHEFCTLLEFRLRNKTVFAKYLKVVLVPIISKCMWLYTTPWQRPTYKVVSLLTRVVLSHLVG